METFFSEKRVWQSGPFLHFVAQLGEEARFVSYADAFAPLFEEYGDRLGVVPAPWLH